MSLGKSTALRSLGQVAAPPWDILADMTLRKVLSAEIASAVLLGASDLDLPGSRLSRTARHRAEIGWALRAVGNEPWCPPALVDEFASHLDRRSARELAISVANFVRAKGLSVVLALVERFDIQATFLIFQPNDQTS